MARLPTPLNALTQIAIDVFIARGKAVGWWADHTAIYLPRYGCIRSHW